MRAHARRLLGGDNMGHRAWAAAAVYSAFSALSFSSFATSAHAAGELVLRRVLLSSAGVGCFEYESDVEGDADLALEVPLDQVDDVLKSIVVYDDRGQLGEVTLPGKAPLNAAFS